MIYVLTGPDDFSISQALDKIKSEMGDAATLDMSTTLLEGQKLSFDELKVTCETIPFMSGQRLVIVNGLLGRFESQGKSRRKKTTTAKPRKNSKLEEAETFGNYLASGIPDSTVLVLTDGVITGDNAVFKALSGKATIRSFALPKDAKLREWVQQRVNEEKGTISPQAAQLLARMVGSNMWGLANEVNKLALFALGRTIEEEDVRMLVSSTQQSSVFNMVDAILEFRAEQAEQILQSLFLAGEAPVYLLFMLSRQVQLIVRAKELKRQKLKNYEIQNRLGMRSEWVMNKTLDQSGRYTMERIREVYQSILDTDIAIKTGKYEPELALNILVAELCSRGGKGVPSAKTRTG